jgi:hypothetical protein
MIWAMTEESLQPWKLQPPRLDTPAGSQGGSLHADDPSILTRTDEQVTRSVRDPAHSFDAVHYKIQSYSSQLDPNTQHAGEIGSRVSANDGEYPIAIRIYQPCEHLPAKGARKQNPKYRIQRSSFGVFLMFGHLTSLPSSPHGDARQARVKKTIPSRVIDR